MVKLRMMRMGSKKRPHYRLMAIDERKQRDGRPLEFLGTYNPGVEPPAVRLELDAIDAWIGKGAQMSGTVRSLVNHLRQYAYLHAARKAGCRRRCGRGRSQWLSAEMIRQIWWSFWPRPL
jgi:small subunit ribosomal protein S16